METTNKVEKLSPKDLQRISDIISKSEKEDKPNYIFFGTQEQIDEYRERLINIFHKGDYRQILLADLYVEKLIAELYYSDGCNKPYSENTQPVVRDFWKYYELLERAYEKFPTLDKPRIEQLLETKLIQSNIILKR